MPALIALGAPRAELAAANGLDSLSRLIGSSTASAIGGTILASAVVVVGGVALHRWRPTRMLFALCATTAVLGTCIALVGHSAGYSPPGAAMAAVRDGPAGQVGQAGTTGATASSPDAVRQAARPECRLPPAPGPAGSGLAESP